MTRFIPAIAAAFLLVAAAPASAWYQEIGVDPGAKLNKPACPTECQVLARVTGYQVQVGTAKNPYQLHRKGYITAFTVALGKPKKSDIEGFQNLFGMKSQARLSLLKLRRRHRRARLVAQSEVFDLTPYFGNSPTFALSKPLRVPGPRHVVALTIPTWAPAFAVGLPRETAWRASRDATRCDDLERPAAVQTIGTIRSYACFYRTARLLYSATFVPDARITNPQTRTSR